MAREPQKNNTVLIIVAIIGVVGTIVALAIGNSNTEKFRQAAELTQIALVSIATQGGATQTVLQNTVDAPTHTPYPTYTPNPTYTIPPTETLTITSTLIATSPPLPTPLLRYDGLYRSVEQDSVSLGYYYLRFYPDGTVLTNTVIGETVLLHKKKYLSMGQYEIEGLAIRFTETSSQGDVDYIGIINGEELTLNVYSHINDYSGIEIYRFIEMPNMQP